MPILYDVSQPRDKDGFLIPLEAPLFGKTEMRYADREFVVRGYPEYQLSVNFDLNEEGDRIFDADKELVVRVHQWADENFQSRWFVHQYLKRFSNTLSFGLYVEDPEDRKRLKGMYSDLFDEKPINIARLAIVKGMTMPLVSADTNIIYWASNNRGFHEYRTGDMYRVKGDTPEIDEKLRSEWVDNKGFLTLSDDGYCQCPYPLRWLWDRAAGFPYDKWLFAQGHHFYKLEKHPTEDRERMRYDFQNKEVEKAFAKRWRNDYWIHTSGGQKSYYVEKHSMTKENEIPLALALYIDGKAPDPTPRHIVRPEPIKPVSLHAEPWYRFGL